MATSGPADLTNLYRRNATWLHAHWPQLWKRVAHGRPSSRLVFHGGQIKNVAFADGSLLYPEDADLHARKQVAAFLARPSRIALGSPAYCNLSPVSFSLYDRLQPSLLANRGGLAELPLVDAGFLFVFGVGLGLHLPALLRTVPCRDVVLVETSAERLRLALMVLDLEGLAAAAAERGMSLRIILEHDVAALQAALERAVLEAGNTFLDGSWLFHHLADPVLRAAVPALAVSLRTLAMSHGFFEDEMMMLCNAHANLSGRRIPLIRERPPAAQPLPALVVGSGPSLDAAALARLKALGGRALVVSCGTTLRILLDNGIRPHLHVEVENNDRVAEHLSDLARQHDLSGITLAASATVRPQVAALFERVWLFSRRTSGVAGLLVTDEESVSWADPTVANAALVVCARLGFRSIVLFGVDCGYRTGQRHHADGSAYFLVGFDTWDRDDAYDRQLPAVSGGTVRSNWVLELGVRSLEEFIRGSGIAVVNASAGAAIAGTVERSPDAIELPEPAASPEDVLAEAARALAVTAPETAATRAQRGGHRQTLEDLERRLGGMLNASDAAADGFGAMARRLAAALPDSAEAIPVLRVVRGSLWSLLRLGGYFGTRLRDAGERDAFARDFRSAYGVAVREMLGELASVLDAIATGRFDGDAAYRGYLERCQAAERRAGGDDSLTRLFPSDSPR